MKFVKNKVLRVLVPYLIVGLLLCLLQHRDLEQMLYGVSHLWFLLSIFECYVLGKIVERVLWIQDKRRTLLLASTILFLVVLSYRIPFTSILCLNRLTTYFPYYFVGRLVCRVDFKTLAKYRSKAAIAILVLLVCFMLQRVYFNRQMVTMAFGVSTVGMVFVYFRTLSISKLPAWLISLDKCSMGIYIVHHVIIQEVNNITECHVLAVDHYYTYPLVQFVVVTLISWQLVALCKKVKYSKYVLG